MAARSLALVTTMTMDSGRAYTMMRRALEAGILCHDTVIDAARRQMTTLDNPGFCLNCGLEHDGCEPDARNYKCESCGMKTVYGAVELLHLLPTST